MCRGTGRKASKEIREVDRRGWKCRGETEGSSLRALDKLFKFLVRFAYMCTFFKV